MTKKSVPTVVSGLAILLTLFGCGDDGGSPEGACAGKGYTEKICAVTGNNMKDSHEWNGTEMIHRGAVPTREENTWGVGFKNTSPVSLDTCTTDGSGSEWDGDESVSKGISENTPILFVAESIRSDYPKGPPCIYYRPHKE